MGRAGFRASRGRLDYDGLAAGSTCLMRALERSGVRFEIAGAAALDLSDGPVVFVCNHMSALETQVLPAIVGRTRPVTFVVKPSLLRYPGFGAVLAAFDPIVVSRTDPRADLRTVLDVGSRRLADGISVIVFPQAHRTDGFQPAAFNTLGMRLARAAGAPMVPIALSTATWTRGSLIEDLGWIVPTRTARFAVGPRIAVGDDAAAAHGAVVAFIGGHLAAWTALETAPAAQRAPAQSR